MNTIWTPWGPSQTVKRLAPGITSVSTAGHGGIKLDPEQLATFLLLIPHPQSYAGLPWFEEDCDWAQVALVFPEAFSDQMLDGAAEMVEAGEYLKNIPESFFKSDHYQTKIAPRLAAFRASIEGKWRRGSMGTCGGGWNVHFTRGDETKWVKMDYPEQTFYTDEELAAATAAWQERDFSKV